MSEDAESKSHAGQWIIAVVGALVLYVLSIGPIWVLAVEYQLSPTAWKTINIFYRPLTFCSERSGPNELMINYFSWWREGFHIQEDE